MRLIDVDELLKDKVSNAYISRFEIENAPTIDAEPVIRCKDCKHHYINEDRIMCNIFCTVFAVSKNHYCSYGVKMDEEQLCTHTTTQSKNE